METRIRQNLGARGMQLGGDGNGGEEREIETCIPWPTVFTPSMFSCFASW